MKIHDMFHLSLLKLCDRAHKGDILPLPPINIEDENKYKVVEILNSRSHYGKLQYFIK